MASQLDIVNEALGLLGEMPIDDIDDTQDPKAVKAKAFWEITRDQLLERASWTFALCRAQLEQDATAPTYGFDYAYTIPSDCINIVDVTIYTDDMERDDRSRASYRVESGRILSNESTLYIKYVRRIEEPGRFSPLFASAMAGALAVKLGASMTKSAAVVQAMLQYSENVLRRAISMDIRQEPVTSRIESSWDDAR